MEGGKQQLSLEGTECLSISGLRLPGAKLVAPRTNHPHPDHLPLPDLHAAFLAHKSHTQSKWFLKKNTLLFHFFWKRGQMEDWQL